MSKISLSPDASGTGIFTIASPNSNTNRTLTLPDDTGTIVTNSGNQAGSFTTLNTSGAVVFNDAGADVDFRVEGDTDANLLFVDASADKVGISTTSPAAKLHIAGLASGADFDALTLRNASTVTGSAVVLGFEASSGTIGDDASLAAQIKGIRTGGGTSGALAFWTNNAGVPGERMRLDSSGNLLVGTTSTTFNNDAKFVYNAGSEAYFISPGSCMSLNRTGTDGNIVFFTKSASVVGNISVTASATAYNTSSDYRLKENIAPMTGALAKVLELNPVTYTWKVDGSTGEGFIAHELQAVCPQAVSGEKDETEIKQVEVSPAVPATYDDEGNELTPAVEAVYEEREVPVYQGVDTSFLVATLTAAIQELSAKNDALEARIAALETGA